MAIYALQKAISCLKSEMLKVRRNEQKVDEQTVISKDNGEVDGNTVSDSGRKIKTDNKEETVNVPDPELHDLDGNQVSLNNPDQVTLDVSEPDNNLKTRVLTIPESKDVGYLGPRELPNNSMVTMDMPDLIFHDFDYYVPEPEFHDFGGDWVEKLFKPNQIWAIYGGNDGMPRFYAFIQKVLSLSPFEVRIAFLSSHTDSEFGEVNWSQGALKKHAVSFVSASTRQILTLTSSPTRSSGRRGRME